VGEFPLHISNEPSFNEDLGLVMAVFESGHSVELSATGYSMFPTLRPGDRIIVKPLMKGELPIRGSVVVYIVNNLTGQGTEPLGKDKREERRSGNGGLVMHRLIGINDDGSGKPLFITRGDSGTEPDKPWPQQQLIGVAVSYKRGKKEQLIKTFIPESWRYIYNLILLWMFSKIMRLNRMVDRLLKSK